VTRRHLILSLLTVLLCAVIVVGQASKQELNDQLYEAVRRSDPAAVTALLDKGADVNAKFRYGATALFKAAERGNADVVKILLARGADVTVKDTFYGATAMSWALDGGHVDVVAALLEKQPKSVNEVLMTGLTEDKPQFTKLALSKGGMDKEVLTSALAMVTASKNTEMVELLKKAGAVPPPEVNKTILESYVGKYKSDQGLEVTFSLPEGVFTAVVAGQRPLQMMAIDDTTFKPITVQSVRVRFKVEAGKVTGFELTEGQRTTQLVKQP
jgi:Ankyrin repeats (3 copies)